DFDQRRVLQAIGLTPRHLLMPALVGRVIPESAAWGVLAEGDEITAIDGQPVDAFDQIGPQVQALGQRGGDGMIEVTRDGERLALEISPRLTPRGDGTDFWALGIEPPGNLSLPEKDALQR